MTDQLKRCPFCGSDKIKQGGDDKQVGAWCVNCQATGPNGYLTINGEFDWNTRVEPAPQWRPIETAPKDVRDLLVFSCEGVQQAWLCETVGEYLTPEGKAVWAEPTHWMPLPEGPEE